MSSTGVIRKRPPNSSSEEKVQYATNESRRVCRDTRTELIVVSDSCSCAYVCIKGKYKNDQQSPIVARSLLRWTVAMLCCMNQWSISVQSSTVWRSIKLAPFARPIPSVRRCVPVRDKSKHCKQESCAIAKMTARCVLYK